MSRISATSIKLFQNVLSSERETTYNSVGWATPEVTTQWKWQKCLEVIKCVPPTPTSAQGQS